MPPAIPFGALLVKWLGPDTCICRLIFEYGELAGDQEGHGADCDEAPTASLASLALQPGRNRSTQRGSHW